MSGALLLGLTAELKGEIDQPLDLLGFEPAGEAGHRAIAFGDALPDGCAVAAAHHGRGGEVEIRIEAQRARISLSPLAMAAGAIGLVELGCGEGLPGAAGERRPYRECCDGRD